MVCISKRYSQIQAEINRDNGWKTLGKKGFEAVRVVAIDENWRALHFRQVELIKTLNRNPSLAMTPTGK